MSDVPHHLLTQQNMLLRQSTERVEIAYLKALRQGLHNPVVLVLDLSSPRGREIARTSGRHQDIERTIQTAIRCGAAPITLWHLPGAVAANLLPPDHKTTVDAVRNWPTQGPPHSYPVVTVGAGVISLAAAPTKHLEKSYMEWEAKPNGKYS